MSFSMGAHSQMIRVVAFDADDTLWHNEDLFLTTRDRFTDLLSEYHEADRIQRHLYETERANLRVFGYGIKGFTLSMIETAVELTDARITASQIREIVDMGREMLDAPMRLFDGVEDVLTSLRDSYRTVIVTKGDLFDQENKLARSGLVKHVDGVEVVSEKNVETFRKIVNRLDVGPSEFVMIGNSMRSDIVPVVELGAHAIHVPYDTEWEHETVAPTDVGDLSYHRITILSEARAVIQARDKPES